MAAAYTLCALASTTCAAMLVRVYWVHHDRVTRLVLWSSWCFMWFAISNALAFVDGVLLRDPYLATVRAAAACLGSGGLLVALIWEME